ncbi:SDR family NAD(P)-dependent oxidoreductase [Isoptericola sp. NPDC056605]|uniref:SDR family NAD(P)-dependent oxidoreductase n=1 Tax=Isoptericola sp. NPDC056605 TaxID=3345876 RepID=UPI0036A6380E
MSTVQGVTAVVGAGGAIGAAIAARLAGEGTVALLDRDAARLADVAASLPERPLVLPVDARDGGAVDAAFAEISRAGGLARLAVAVGTTSGGSIHELDEASWDTILGSNLTTVFHSLRAGVGTLRHTGGPVCVIGSVHAADPQPGYPAYAAAKAAVAALVRQVAAEYGHVGVRANLVTPGWTRAPHTVGRLEPQDEAALLDTTPLRELVEPSDLAEAVAWLMSGAASRVTGAEIVVDGGASLLGGATVLRQGYRQRLGLDASR